LAGAGQLLGRRRDENAGAMCGEHAGEPHGEAVARPRRRKSTKAEAESRPPDQKKTLILVGVFVL